MPEEVNRILCDHVSTLLFSPTKSGFNNLLNEGFSKEYSNNASADHPNIYHCGDVMYDNSLYFSKLSDENSDILEKLINESNLDINIISVDHEKYKNEQNKFEKYFKENL